MLELAWSGHLVWEDRNTPCDRILELSAIFVVQRKLLANRQGQACSLRGFLDCCGCPDCQINYRIYRVVPSADIIGSSK
jgi:hypothetical protein